MANAQPAPDSVARNGVAGTERASESPRYWIVPIARAVIALIPAAVITFSPNHSAQFGLIVFGAFAVLSGLLTGILSWRMLGDPVTRNLFVIQGVVGVVAGAFALAVNAGGLGFFLYLVSVWAAITGFVELYSGVRLRSRRGTPKGSAARGGAARDWMFAGILTAVLALVFLLLPPNDVVSVGLLGAYFVVLGVFLLIGGFSLKFTATDAARSLANATNESDAS